MRKVSDKICRESQKAHFVFNNYFFPENLGDNVEKYRLIEPDRPQMTIWRMRIACWEPKATNTRSQYAIIIAFPLQQWLNEQALMLRLSKQCRSWSRSCRESEFVLLSVLLCFIVARDS
jgi:hypothetical protein